MYSHAYYVEHIYAYYDAVDDGRTDDLLALFADDITYNRPGQPGITGEADLEAFYRRERPLSEGHHAVHDLLVDDDQVAVRGTYSGVQTARTWRSGSRTSTLSTRTD